MQRQLPAHPRHVPRLAAGIDERSGDASGQPARLDHEIVRVGLVQAQPVAQAVREVGEAAGDEQRLQAAAPRGIEQHAGPGRQRDPFPVHALEHAFVQPGERGDALPEALRPVDLAAHRRGGDRSDLRLASGEVGDLVDALDGDERGIHVQREHPEIREAAALRDEPPVERGRAAQRAATTARVPGSARRMRNASPVMRSMALPPASVHRAFRSAVAMSAPWTTRSNALMPAPVSS